MSDKQREDIHVIKSGSDLDADELYKEGKEKFSELEYRESFRFFMRSAEKGHVGAQYEVAKAYDYGMGVNKNAQEARKWYKLAADNGNGYAESRLASLNKDSIKPTLNKNNAKLHKRCMPCIFYENQYCKYKCRYTGVYDKACDFYVEERSECCKSCLHYDGSRCKNIKCPFYNLYREINSKCLNYERE